MNRAMGFSLRTPASDGACLRDGPRGARHWAHLRAANFTRGWHCQGSSSSNTRPVVESVARARLLAAALMPAEPHIRSPFTERLAPQSLILEVIGLGRVGPHCMSAYRSHCLRRSARPDPTWLIRPRGTRDNDSAFPDASDWLHDSTRRDLAMGDISPEGDEQFAGERYDRDAAGPAAL